MLDKLRATAVSILERTESQAVRFLSYSYFNLFDYARSVETLHRRRSEMLVNWLALLAISLICNSFFFNILFPSGLLVSMSVLFLVLLSDHGLLKIKKALFLGYFITLLITSLAWRVAGVYNLEHVVVTIIGILLGYGVSSEKIKLNRNLSWIPLFSSLVLFIVMVVYTGGYIDIFEQNSYNYLSITLIGAFLSYPLLAKDFSVTGAHVAFSFIVFIACSYVGGRAGIITSLIIFLASTAFFIYNKSEKFNKPSKLFLYFSLVFFGSIALYMSFMYMLSSGSFDRFLNKGFSDYSRIFIISTYIGSLNIVEVLIGKNVLSIKELGYYGFNMHNTYAYIHSLYGIIYFLSFILLLLWVHFKLFKRGEFFISICFFALCLRALTDTQVFSGRFDFIVFGLSFILLDKFRCLRMCTYKTGHLGRASDGTTI